MGAPRGDCLLHASRSVLWHVPDVLAGLHRVLTQWEEAHFVRQLPRLRLSFSQLTPQECDKVARAVGNWSGGPAIPLDEASIPPEDRRRGQRIENRIRGVLRQDGLETIYETFGE